MTFRGTLTPDTPIANTARAKWDNLAWSTLDGRVIDLQQFLSELLLGGAVCSYATVAGTSPALAAGDVICLAGAAAGTVTLATPTPLAAAGGPLGVVMEAATPGALVRYAIAGRVSPSITGLGASAGAAKVNGDGRLTRVASLSAGDYGMGVVDAAGWLTLGGSSGGGLAAVPASRTLATTSPLQIDGAASADLSANRTLSIQAADATHDGYYPQGHYTLVNGATATPTASKIVRWDASKFLAAGTGTPSTTACFNGVNNARLLGVRDNGDTTDLSAVASVFDGLAFGDVSNGASADLQAKASGFVRVVLGSTVTEYVTAKGVTLFKLAQTLGGGTNVLEVGNADTEPTTNPTDSALVYVGKTGTATAGDLKTRSLKGQVVTLAPASNATAAVNTRPWWRVSAATADATTTTLITIDLPPSCSILLHVRAQMQQHGTDLRAAYILDVLGGRGGAGLATVDGAANIVWGNDLIGLGSPPVTVDDDGVHALRVRLTGAGGTNVDWMVDITASIFSA